MALLLQAYKIKSFSLQYTCPWSIFSIVFHDAYFL